MQMIWIWLAILAVGLIFEVIEAGTLVSVWFSAGAIIPLFMSFWRTNNPYYITAQVLIFGAVTVLCLVYARKIAQKFLLKNNHETTNLDSVVGTKTKITSVNGDICYVKINGIEYRAICKDESAKFKVSEEVELEKFEGNKVVIKKL